MQFIKRSSEYFLFFVDWIDSHIGCGGGHSDGCDRVWAGKALPNLFKIVGGGEDQF